MKGKLAKTGDSLLRVLLIQGAQIVRWRLPELPRLYLPSLCSEEMLANRSCSNKIVAALARKHLVFVYHVWKRGEAFDIERYRQRRAATTPAPSEPVALVPVGG